MSDGEADAELSGTRPESMDESGLADAGVAADEECTGVRLARVDVGVGVGEGRAQEGLGQGELFVPADGFLEVEHSHHQHFPPVLMAPTTLCPE